MAAIPAPTTEASRPSGRPVAMWCGLLLSIAAVVLTACAGASDPAPESLRMSCVDDSYRAYQWLWDEFWVNADVYDARIIVACGPGLGKRDGLGRTPLHLAVEYDAEPAVIAVLLEYGADIEARDGFGDTPLHTATEGGDPAIVAVLLEGGADTEAEDDFGRTPLHYAIVDGNLPVTAALLDHGANIEAKNDFGDTPLHVAAGKGNAAVVEVLLDHGANIEAKKNLDDTPLETAAFRGNRATMSVLLDRGANVGDLYWSEPTLRQLIDERETGAKPAASAASSGT